MPFTPIQTIKFSQMTSGGNLTTGEQVPGLLSGGNVLFTQPWAFLPPGTTAERPTPAPAMYYLLRLNTDLGVYEYYNPTTSMWTELSGSGTGTIEPGPLNAIAYYGAAGTTLYPIDSANSSVFVTDSMGNPSFSTTLPAGLTIPGYQPSITPAALTEVNDTNVTMTLGGSPTTALLSATSMTLGWTGLLGIARGGTDVSSVTIAPTAIAFAGWDANKNMSANAFIQGYTTTATAASTTALTVGSTWQQYFTGTTTQTVTLPQTSTLVLGQSFYVINNSTGNVTVQTYADDAVQIMTANTDALYTCISTSSDLAAAWNTNYVYDAVGVTSITGTAHQVIASASTGNITLSLPQSIDTTSSPTFANLTLTNPLGVGDGGTGLASIVAQELLYGASAGIIGQLATSDSAVLVTDSSGNPSLNTTLPAGLTIPGYQTTITPAALTKANDTNVTLTLSGNPTDALLAATEITAGWTGTLSGARGGTGIDNSGLTINLGSATTGYVLTSDSSGNATWQIASGTGSVTTLDADSGSAMPTTGVITVSGGSTGLTTSASSSTLDLAGVLNLASGGTNHNLTANAGGIVWSDASKLNILAGTATANQLLLSGDAATPAWSTSTYPATNAVNTLLYASSANVMAALATADNGVLITSSLGVPSWLANGTAGYVLTANSGAPPSWQAVESAGAIETIDGDSGSLTPTAGTVTISGGTTGLTTSGSGSTLDLTGTLKLANGGTNASLTASNGGIFYSTASAGAILAGTATANQILMSGSSTTPAWSTATYPATTTVNQVLYSSSANVIAGITAVDSAVMISSAGGVPSFSTTLPSGLTIPGYQTTITPAALTETNDTNVTLTLGGTPASSLLAAVSITAGWSGTLAVARGGTGVGSVTVSPTATAFAGWDANKNLSANNHIQGYTTTASSIVALVLTVSSTYQQYITGILAQTITLPVTNTLVLGQSFLIVNNSSMAATVQSSGSNTITTIAAGTSAIFTCILTTGTTAASWNSSYAEFETPIALSQGGTSAALTASNGGIFYSTASAAAILAGTATAGQLLTSGASTTPAWTTSTYPATNAANTLLYASSANTMAALATANSSALLTNGSGVPAWVSNSGTGNNALVNSPTFITPTLGAALATSINFGGASLSTYSGFNTWTPVFTCATPGNLSVSYSIQDGVYSIIGNICTVSFTINCTPTFTTASGSLTITGLPFTSNSNSSNAAYGSCYLAGTFNLGSTTYVTSFINPNQAYIQAIATQSNHAGSQLSIGTFTTGAAVEIAGTLTYLI